MRIAVWHNLSSGGGKRALFDQVRGLIDAGHSVEAWCPPTADRTFLPLSELAPEHVVPLADPAAGRGNPRGPLGPGRRMAARLRAMDDHCRAVAGQIDAGGFDVTLAHPCIFFRVTPLARHLFGPAAVYVAEPYRPLYEASGGSVDGSVDGQSRPRLPWLAAAGLRDPAPSPRKWLGDLGRVAALRLQAREEVDNAAAYGMILVNSQFTREAVLRAYGLESRVCYLGIDAAKFPDHGLPRENLVVGLGALIPEKRADFVIRAVGSIPAARRPALHWVGNMLTAGLGGRLAALAAGCGVDFRPRVGVGDAELVDLLNRARLMAYAPRLEPFGLAPLEANACGCPVVAVAEGGVRETVLDGVNGLLVGATPAEMGAGIDRLASDPALAEELGRAARRRVLDRWSPAAANARLVGLLEEVRTPNPPAGVAMNPTPPDTTAAPNDAPPVPDLPLAAGSTRALSERSGSYMVELDGLRAALVGTVMITHFNDRTGGFMPGSAAVRVFFVLSGFLITGILLKVRRDAVAGPNPGGDSWLGLRRFYARRFLRIFPVYYLALAALIAFNAMGIRGRWGWDALYLTNIYIPIHGAVGVVEGHFWSLAVEEQFYLFWPWVVLFCRREWLVRGVVAMVAAGPIYRLGMVLAMALGGADRYWIWMPLPASFDSLGLGALLALASSPHWGVAHWREPLCRVGLWVGVPVLLALAVWSYLWGIYFPSTVVFESSCALVGVWLVGRGATGYARPVGRVMAWAPVAYLGVISYGIYVWHNLFNWYFLPAGLAALGMPPQRWPAHLAVYVAGSLLLATASWFALERPVNALKRFFPYRDKPAGQSAAAAPLAEVAP